MTTMPNTDDRRKKFTIAVFVYLSFLYATLGVTPYFFRWLLRTLGRDAYAHSITLFLAGAALLIMFNWRDSLKTLTVPRWVGLVCVGAGYVGILNMVAVAAKQLHTLQYGLLVWLVMETMRGKFPLSRVYAQAALITMAAAALDEGIQAWLPNRHGQMADVLLDGLSILLAQATILLVRDAGEIKLAGGQTSPSE